MTINKNYKITYFFSRIFSYNAMKGEHDEIEAGRQKLLIFSHIRY